MVVHPVFSDGFPDCLRWSPSRIRPVLQYPESGFIVRWTTHPGTCWSQSFELRLFPFLGLQSFDLDGCPVITLVFDVLFIKTKHIHGLSGSFEPDVIVIGRCLSHLSALGQGSPEPVQTVIPHTVDDGLYDRIRGRQFPTGPCDDGVAGHRDEDMTYRVDHCPSGTGSRYQFS